MSVLSEFASTASKKAFSVIGTAELRIDGGPGLACVWNEVRLDRDFLEGGQQVELEFEAVVETALFELAYPDALKNYEGKAATKGEDSYRVARFERGDSFLTVFLKGPQQAP